MILTAEILSQKYQVNTDFSWSLAIPLAFNQAQPNHFDAPIAQATSMKAGGFTGDTEQGGSCNVNELSFNPHCNGTHTETIAHICDASAELSLKVADITLPAIMPCTLISITPELAQQSNEQYTPEFMANDAIISKRALESALSNVVDEHLQALVIRTLPNSIAKCSATYSQAHQPAFFSRDAIYYLNERGVEHLLVDIPSIDRLHDDGLLTCHHLFWQVAEGTHQASANSLSRKTITEMAYIDENIEDGLYFLNLQMPAFINDAAPSKPVLYSATPLYEYID